MPFPFRRDSETRPSQKSCQMVPCFFRSMSTPTLRPFSSVTNWIPIMALFYFSLAPARVGSVLFVIRTLPTCWSNQLDLQHSVRVRRETVVHLFALSVGGPFGCFHFSRVEIVLRLDVSTIDFRTGDLAGKLFVLGFDLRGNGLILAAIDHVQHQRSVIVRR